MATIRNSTPVRTVGDLRSLLDTLSSDMPVRLQVEGMVSSDLYEGSVYETFTAPLKRATVTDRGVTLKDD